MPTDAHPVVLLGAGRMDKTGDTLMRRLPVYILLDTSGSMRGEPIAAVDNAIEVMLDVLRQDPHALESVCLAVVAFDLEVRVMQPLTPLADFPRLRLSTPQSGPTFLGEALRAVSELAAREVRRGKDGGPADWAPLLFVMTDGKPSDTQVFGEWSVKVRESGFASIVGCGAGPAADLTALSQFCDHVAALATLDGPGFEKFFTWVSDVIADGSRSRADDIAGAAPGALPPPPDEINIAL